MKYIKNKEIHNPCKQCIVKIMCQNPCQNAKDYIENRLMFFKPYGSPPTTNPEFLSSQCFKILKRPTRYIQVLLTFPDDVVKSCRILVYKYDIVELEIIREIKFGKRDEDHTL